MSGDVQPRKRKDKSKKKRDELTAEEPRGTAAALGEGDLFIHSYHDHGTGGHWCAKIIFFSLLAILITLIGLIILENRGLSELEANAVESRYSGVLDGWVEDAPGDDHHDEHTLELKHHDDEEQEAEDEDEHDDDDIEVEKIEKESFDDDEPISTELPALPEKEDDDDDDDKHDGSDDGDETDNDKDDDDGDKSEDEDDDDDDFLDPDDDDLPIIEHIAAPSGKPFREVDEDKVSTDRPPDTLDQEEEYEKQQEKLRIEEEQASHKDGGNSLEELWPGEPSEPYWLEQLDQAERELNQGGWEAAVILASQAKLSASGRARSVLARSYDALAETKRDNLLLTKAINAYIELLKMHNSLDDKKLLEATNRTIDRIYFRGIYLSAEPVYKLLIRRFPNEVKYRNNLTSTYLMADRTDLAEPVLKETLRRWPNDSLALGLYAFILKNEHKKYDDAIKLFEKAVKGQVRPEDGARFYFHWGEALMLSNRFEEANDVHKKGANLGYFLSASQRSPHAIKRLKSQPWWNIDKTPYSKVARDLEKSWKEILYEGEAARKLYEEENEGLRTNGEWSQMDLFARGQEIPGRCKRAPVTCSILRRELSRHGMCHQGQIKFSLMGPGTHVRPHVGPTNCRLRIHLGLSNTKDTYIRVDKEIRQWQEGKVLIFDDSFEHEVWHNGSRPRLVLIVDVWHPELTPREKLELPVI